MSQYNIFSLADLQGGTSSLLPDGNALYQCFCKLNRRRAQEFSLHNLWRCLCLFSKLTAIVWFTFLMMKLGVAILHLIKLITIYSTNFLLSSPIISLHICYFLPSIFFVLSVIFYFLY